MPARRARSKAELVEAIRIAGVVGCGGAGFPTYAKFSGPAPDCLIINAAECEPLLRTDRYVARHHAGEVVSAAAEVASAISAGSCTIALKESYRDEISALERAIDESRANVSLCSMKSFYPAGDEQIMVREVTGRVVPPGGIPLDVSCVVSNISTMLAVRGALDGRPFTRRYLTVTGEVRSPAIVDAPIGAPLASCLDAAGGSGTEDFCVLLGGPMMGRVVSKENFSRMHVTKTTSGIVVLPLPNRLEDVQRISVRRMAVRARAACIRCSMCTDLCPRNLLGHPLEPHRVMRALALCGDLDGLPTNDSAVRGAALCCECGVCEIVACPMGLQPRRINAELKKILAKNGTKYEKGAGQRQPNVLRDSRKVPTGRSAARAGVYRCNSIEIDRLVRIDPEGVVLSLAQHIGAPCEPVVSSGEAVAAGQIIAESPEGKLGSVLHASIGGTAEVEGGAIAIGAKKGAEQCANRISTR